MAEPVASKNIYELLGNDPEIDAQEELNARPAKAIDKKVVVRSGKRNPVEPAASTSVGGNDEKPSAANTRAQNGDNVRRDRHPRNAGDKENNGAARGGRGGARGRGSRGRGGAPGDRHDRSGKGIDSVKKDTVHGFGNQKDANGELSAEHDGEADANQEEAAEGVVADSSEPVAESAAPAEEEDKTESYAAYLARQAEERAALNGSSFEIRKPEDNDKHAKGSILEKAPEANFFEGKTKEHKPKERKANKQVLDIDQSWKEDAAGSSSSTGGRGGESRGGRGGARGGARGGRGDRGGARGGPRGGANAGRGGNPRGGARGGNSSSSGASSGPRPNFSSANDFPSLGA